MGIMPQTDKEPIEMYESIWVAVFASTSRPGLKHYTLWDPFESRVDDCSCEGYKAHEYCWHKEWVENNWA